MTAPWAACSCCRPWGRRPGRLARPHPVPAAVPDAQRCPERPPARTWPSAWPSRPATDTSGRAAIFAGPSASRKRPGRAGEPASLPAAMSACGEGNCVARPLPHAFVTQLATRQTRAALLARREPRSRPRPPRRRRRRHRPCTPSLPLHAAGSCSHADGRRAGAGPPRLPAVRPKQCGGWGREATRGNRRRRRRRRRRQPALPPSFKLGLGPRPRLQATA